MKGASKIKNEANEKFKPFKSLCLIFSKYIIATNTRQLKNLTPPPWCAGNFSCVSNFGKL